MEALQTRTDPAFTQPSLIVMEVLTKDFIPTTRYRLVQAGVEVLHTSVWPSPEGRVHHAAVEVFGNVIQVALAADVRSASIEVLHTAFGQNFSQMSQMALEVLHQRAPTRFHSAAIEIFGKIRGSNSSRRAVVVMMS